MEIRPIPALPIALTIVGTAANAAAPAFSEFDNCADGMSGIEPAKAVLSEIEISDKNGDGFVNHFEVKQAVEGLSLPEQFDSDHESVAAIDAQNYRLIVQSMEVNRQGDA